MTDELAPWISDKPKPVPTGYPFMTKCVQLGRFAIWFYPWGFKGWRLMWPEPTIGTDWQFQIGPLVFKWYAPDQKDCEREGHKPIYFVSEKGARRRGFALHDYHTCRCRCVQYFRDASLEDAQSRWKSGPRKIITIESIEFIGPKE